MKRASFIMLVTILVIGTFVRAYLAPYSTGSDIPQFLGFANTIFRHGLKFYDYASSNVIEQWPYPWPYIYGPLWAVILGFIRYYFAPRAYMYTYWIDGTYYVKVSVDWIMAVKSILILADMINYALIYLVALKITGKTKYALLASALYFLNPMVIYISGIYGMFDQLALTPMLISLYLLLSNTKELMLRKMLAIGMIMGISLMIKHILLPIIPFVLIYIAKRISLKNALALLSGIFTAIIAIMTPFIVFSNKGIFHLISLFIYPLNTYYVEPLCYSFNGISSLITYIHKYYGVELSFLLKFWILPFLALSIAILYVLLRYRINLILLLTLSYLTYIATYWRINHQYFVPLIAFMSLTLIHILYPRTTGKIKLLTCLTMAVLYVVISFWVFMYPISFWFHTHMESPNWELVRLLDSLSLMVFNEEYYLIYALTLTIIEYTCIVVLIDCIKKASPRLK